MTIRTGDLNRRISIQSRSAALDTFGQRLTTWTDVLVCWAGIDQLVGRELVLGQAVHNEVTHKVTILYRSTVTPQMRVVYWGRNFNIQSVIDPNTAHEFLELMCSEGLNEG